MHQDPCVRLFMVAFLHGVQRTARKHIFPLSDIDTLVFGTPDAIYLLRKKWNSSNLFDGSLMKLCQSRQLSAIGNLLSLSLPSVSSDGFLHTVCSITVPYSIHSVTALQLAYEKRNKHFSVYSKNVSDVPNGKAGPKATPSNTLTS